MKLQLILFVHAAWRLVECVELRLDLHTDSFVSISCERYTNTEGKSPRWVCAFVAWYTNVPPAGATSFVYFAFHAEGKTSCGFIVCRWQDRRCFPLDFFNARYKSNIFILVFMGFFLYKNQLILSLMFRFLTEFGVWKPNLISQCHLSGCLR